MWACRAGRGGVDIQGGNLQSACFAPAFAYTRASIHRCLLLCRGICFPSLQMAEEEVRAKDEFKAQKEESKRKRDHDKAWESSRDGRVGTWRDFMAGKGGKKKAQGGIKPPKSKTRDDDKLYVQRAVGAEEFRPQQVKRG